MATAAADHRPPAMAAGAQHLPTAVLARILQCVPLQQRMLCCAAVCKAWAAAAVAATNSISITKPYVPKSLGAWLQQHGSGVDSLELDISSECPSPEEDSDEEDDYCEDVDQQSDGSGEPATNLFASNSHVPFEQRTDGVSGRISTHHSGLSSSDRDMAAPYKLQLPSTVMRQLTRLSFSHGVLDLSTQPQRAVAQQLGGTGDSRSAFAVPPKLLDLKLVNCQLSSQAAMQQLFSTAGAQLTRLHVEGLDWSAADPHDDDGFVMLRTLVSALQPCSGLVALHLDSWHQYRVVDVSERMRPSPVAGISRLQQLQELVLYWPYAATATYLPTLPPSITQLTLSHQRGYHPAKQGADALVLPQLQHLRALKVCAIPLSEAGLCSLTQLQSLQLEQYEFSAASLARMTQLQELVLHECKLTTPARIAAASGTTLSAPLLMQALGQLTQLRVLEVVSTEDGWRPCQEHSRAFAETLTTFSAFTASTQLQRLCVDGYNKTTLPRGAAQHMFPARRQLPQLQSLDISKSDHDFYHKSSWCLSSRDLSRIPAACPSLTSLTFQGLLQPGADPSALLRLRQCRSLSVGGRTFNNSAAVVVARMTQLTSLRWWCSHGFDSRGLQQLTALRRLEEVVLVPVVQKIPYHIEEAIAYSCDYDVPLDYNLQPASEMEPDLLCLFGLSSTDRKWVVFSSHCHCAAPSTDRRRPRTSDVLTFPNPVGKPVWLQLQELCERSPWLAPNRLQQLVAANQQLQHRVEQQQDTITQQQDTIRQLMQRVQQLEAAP